MSHLRPEDRTVKRGRAACRKGRHFYSEPQRIGGGILRQVCEDCGEVTIDLTGADEVTTPIRRRRTTIGPRADG